MKIHIIIIGFLFCINTAVSQNWQQFGSGLIAGQGLTVDSAHNRLCTLAKIIYQGDTILTPAFWNGSQWVRIGSIDFTNTGGPYKLYIYDSTYYVGGAFNIAAGAIGNRLLKFNGAFWDTLPYSPDGKVLTMLKYGNDLYIGGEFNNFGSLYSPGVIGYSPQSWTLVPDFTLLTPLITSFGKFDNKLIIGGAFAADLTLSYYGNIAAWDGDSILPLGDGLEYIDWFSAITDMEEYNGKLYIAGNFRLYNVPNAFRIVSWDGQIFSEVGGGTDYDINALQIFNGELYAAGQFQYAGSLPASRIAKWDGFKWCSLGDSINGAITDMCVFNNELYILGTFTQINGQSIEHIARWVGGNYVDSCQSFVGVNEISMQNIFLYPTVAEYRVHIQCLPEIRFDRVEVFNVLGNKIHYTNYHDGELDISNLQQGVYLVKINFGKNFLVKRFIKE
jgi:hypothetical protein